jgi:hypothetical protein
MSRGRQGRQSGLRRTVDLDMAPRSTNGGVVPGIGTARNEPDGWLGLLVSTLGIEQNISNEKYFLNLDGPRCHELPWQVLLEHSNNHRRTAQKEEQV